jgi:translation initiation factor IF-1
MKDMVELDGVIIGVYRNGAAIELASGSVIKGFLSGKLMFHKIRVMVGDKVRCEVSLHDPTRARIIWRTK